MSLVLRLGFVLLLGVIIFLGVKDRFLPDSDMDTRWEKILIRLHNKFPNVERMSRQELSQLLSEGNNTPIILDTRAKEEYDVSHLSSAINVISIDDLLHKRPDIKKDDVIVTYCSVGYRSSALARELKNRGYMNVKDLEGSIFTWANEGRLLMDEKGHVKKVHPYNQEWGRLLDKKYHP